ncbi:MAG TPA: acyl-CoA dehydrogenase family protein [Chitinophagales bacterium]|nr:acyl-CoA dehydrogenase family protein [Chitinophagales bacterium]
MSNIHQYYFTEEHEMFRKSIRDFLQKEAIPHIDRWEEEQKIDRDFWKKFGEMGYFGLNYPEQYGGSNLDFFYNVVMLEEISKVFSGGFTTTAAVHTYMATPYILQHGSEYLKENYLVPSLTGEKIAAIGITEPGAGSDVANIQTKAVKGGDHYIINGSKTFITNGVYGQYVIVVCKTNPAAGAAGVSLIVVDLDQEGVTKTKLKKLGWHASDTAEIHFDDVKVPVKNLLGEEGKGFYYIMNGLQVERLTASVIGYAACESVLEYSLKYMNERKAFGKTINKFQVLRHRVAQLASEIEVLKAFVLQACKMHADGLYVVKESSIAKLMASELGNKCMYQCLQFFGGYGYMEEYKVARAFRDSRIGTIAGGTSEIMLEIIAKMVIDDVSYNKSQESGIKSQEVDTVEGIFATLPERFRKEKAATADLTMHFSFTSKNYTVKILNGTLNIEDGLNGTPNCTVETDDETYVAVETGKINPQEAFMTGKIRVSDLMSMMTFGGLFRKLS